MCSLFRLLCVAHLVTLPASGARVSTGVATVEGATTRCEQTRFSRAGEAQRRNRHACPAIYSCAQACVQARSWARSKERSHHVQRTTTYLSAANRTCRASI